MMSITDSKNDNDDYLFSGFDAYNCSGDSVYDIFENEDYIITEDLNVWVNANKIIWEGRVIKITYSDLQKYSNYLKLIWIDTKKEDRVFIKKLSKDYKKK